MTFLYLRVGRSVGAFSRVDLLLWLSHALIVLLLDSCFQTSYPVALLRTGVAEVLGLRLFCYY